MKILEADHSGTAFEQEVRERITRSSGYTRAVFLTARLQELRLTMQNEEHPSLYRKQKEQKLVKQINRIKQGVFKEMFPRNI